MDKKVTEQELANKVSKLREYVEQLDEGDVAYPSDFIDSLQMALNSSMEKLRLAKRKKEKTEQNLIIAQKNYDNEKTSGYQAVLAAANKEATDAGTAYDAALKDARLKDAAVINAKTRDVEMATNAETARVQAGQSTQNTIRANQIRDIQHFLIANGYPNIQVNGDINDDNTKAAIRDAYERKLITPSTTTNESKSITEIEKMAGLISLLSEAESKEVPLDILQAAGITINPNPTAKQSGMPDKTAAAPAAEVNASPPSADGKAAGDARTATVTPVSQPAAGTTAQSSSPATATPPSAQSQHLLGIQTDTKYKSPFDNIDSSIKRLPNVMPAKRTLIPATAPVQKTKITTPKPQTSTTDPNATYKTMAAQSADRWRLQAQQTDPKTNPLLYAQIQKNIATAEREAGRTPAPVVDKSTMAQPTLEESTYSDETSLARIIGLAGLK